MNLKLKLLFCFLILTSLPVYTQTEYNTVSKGHMLRVKNIKKHEYFFKKISIIDNGENKDSNRIINGISGALIGSYIGILSPGIFANQDFGDIILSSYETSIIYASVITASGFLTGYYSDKVFGTTDSRFVNKNIRYSVYGCASGILLTYLLAVRGSMIGGTGILEIIIVGGGLGGIGSGIGFLIGFL